MKKGFAILGIIFLGVVIFAAATGYLKYKNRKPQESAYSKPRPLSYSPSPQSVPAQISTDPTVNWKIYTNLKHRYQIKYPIDWQVKSQKDSGSTITVEFQSDNYKIALPETGGNFVPGAQSGMWFQIYSYPAYNYKTFEQYQYFQETQSTAFPKDFFTTFKNITIGGAKGVLKTGGTPLHSFEDFAYTMNNDTVYQFTMISVDNQDKLFQQLLSTFKFPQ